MTSGQSARTYANVTIAVSGVLALCAVAAMLLVPKPSVERIKREQRASRDKLLSSLTVTRRQARALESQNAARLWSGDGDTVTAAVLGRLIREADGRHVMLAGFRSQRTQDFGAVRELPYVVQAAGPYPAVRALVAALDAPGTRIALRTVQIAATDGSSDTVAATIGVSVFTKIGAQRVTVAGKEGDTNG